jgi:hypothetical protein
VDAGARRGRLDVVARAEERRETLLQLRGLSLVFEARFLGTVAPAHAGSLGHAEEIETGDSEVPGYLGVRVIERGDAPRVRRRRAHRPDEPRGDPLRERPALANR